MEDQERIELLILAGWVIMFLLAMGVILFFSIHRRKMLEKEARIRQIEYESQMKILTTEIETEDYQKKKIANDLHDQIISKLSFITTSIENNLNDFENKKPDVLRFGKDIFALREIISDVRNISYDMYPPVLVQLGLIIALKDVVETINKNAGSSADFFDETNLGKNSFAEVDQLSIYRICLELLNNLVKHAKYQSLVVKAKNNKDVLLLEFQHNGQGLTNEEVTMQSQTSKSLGLNSIKSRLILLSASINYFKKDSIYFIHVEIPYKK